MSTIEQDKSRPKCGSWAAFLSENEHSINHIQLSERAARDQFRPKKESEVLDEVMSSFLDFIASPKENTEAPLNKDIESLKKIMDGVLAAKQQVDLTDDEALELVKFIVSKFVERRVNRSLCRLLPLRDSKRWFYTSHKFLR
jgi:hypothetical protein